MAKKTKENPQEVEAAKSVIKLRLTVPEARSIRVAAALNDEQPGAYARRVVLDQARKELQGAKDKL